MELYKNDLVNQAISWIQGTFSLNQDKSEKRFIDACYYRYLDEDKLPDAVIKNTHFLANKSDLTPEEFSQRAMARNIIQYPERNDYFKHVASFFLSEALTVTYQEASQKLRNITGRFTSNIFPILLKPYGFLQRNFINSHEQKLQEKGKFTAQKLMPYSFSNDSVQTPDR